MMQYASWAAKALTAMGVAFLAAVVQYNLELPAWVFVAITTLLAGVAVFLVPNGERP